MSSGTQISPFVQGRLRFGTKQQNSTKQKQASISSSFLSLSGNMSWKHRLILMGQQYSCAVKNLQDHTLALKDLAVLDHEGLKCECSCHVFCLSNWFYL